MCRVAVPDVVRDNGGQQSSNEWAFNGAFNTKNERSATPTTVDHMLKTTASVCEFVPDFFAPPVAEEHSYIDQQEPSLEQSDMLQCLDAFSEPLASSSDSSDEFVPSQGMPQRTFSAFMEACEYGSNDPMNFNENQAVKTENNFDLEFDLGDLVDFGIPDEGSLVEPDNTPLGFEQEKNSCPSSPESSYESDGWSSPKPMFSAQVAQPPKPVLDMSEQVGIILALPGDGEVIYRTDLAAPNAANEHGVKRSRFKGVRWYRRTGRWVVQLRDGGRRKHLGYFTNEILAGRAYAKAINEIQQAREDGLQL